MRREFHPLFLEEAKKNDKIWLITGDLGFGMWNNYREQLPERFINVGAAEQCMVGVAVGLALEGKIPFCYTITSFYLRAAETIALYLKEEQIPARLIGGGLDKDYLHDGISHFGMNAQAYLGMLGIESLYPQTKEELPEVLDKMIKSDKPMFLGLRR